MSGESESFLSRWSRRKLEADREALRPTAPPTPEVADAGGQSAGAQAGQTGGIVQAASTGPVSGAEASAAEVQLPPIESLDGLRSDYVAFFQQSVADGLKRAALKKLVSDPHFNQMDGLDVYIDDYTQFEPLVEESRLRLLGSSEFLNRLDHLPEALPATAQSAPAAPTTSPSDANLAEAPPAGEVMVAQADAAATPPATDDSTAAPDAPSSNVDAQMTAPEPDPNRTP